ncbi:hypothetical protein MS2017_1199 [Bathymodiolus thermophilus thioautotrophic gill symbiont]|uniref:Cadherin domain-containing protein n=1 Tax=Bathymodiolus thermophilus thioautotrophic gill symbiont TaxID=2360 RepID=A0A3G3IMF4_9GAMM|nr:cadherin domain-containing protein [Bathymodiolus thermophilus thioautotrophic gill symbiont]AYQ56898.1 hypothetical protein MS2017_1199 [Bathymodiolus thermophilus thioautotrophic gill symbiont]
MNTLNHFIISILLILFASQAFAVKPTITTIERSGNKTILITFDQPVKPHPLSDNLVGVKLYSDATYYLGTQHSGARYSTEYINPVNDYSQQMEITLGDDSFRMADASGKTSVTALLDNVYITNATNQYNLDSYIKNLVLAFSHDLTITSTNNLNANEGISLIHTLATTNTAATFSIIENTSNLFSLSGTNNAILAFNGTTTNYKTKKSYTVKVKATIGNGDNENTEQTITVTINNILTINNQTLSVNENASIDTNIGNPLVTTGTITAFAITAGNNDGFFKINTTTGQIQVAKLGLDYETKQNYTLTVKITGADAEDKTAEISINIINLKENTLTIGAKTLFVDENALVNTDVGNVNATGTITTYTITTGNNDGFFAINNTGQIQIAKLGLDHETKQVYILTIKITGTDAKDETAQITIRLNNLNDTTPANITLSKKNIVLGEPAGTVIGTLFATDPDDGDLIYTVNDTNNFEISDNKLKIKQVTTEIRTYPITITANDSLHTSEPQSFNITITATYIAAPVISQFSITQGENKGPLISKDGGEVTVSTSAGTGTYAWSSADFSNTSTNKTFVFNPQSVNVGTRTITLKVTAGDFSSERVLKLKLVDTYPNGRTDINGNGISDSKELRNSNNELLTTTNKKITSSGDTRILPSIMGEDSGQLTPDQLKQYRVANHLSDYTKDTLTTGDIYSYIVEGLSATGDFTQVTIELSTPIPANAVLRQYSLATGWRNFVVGNNNIQSKINASNVCTDTDGTWQTGLITGATCLKLTLKDGGENDADDNHANGVVESTISIATPVIVGGNDDSNDNGDSSSGGGCVYNPNAPARFDIVFILLMTLSAYYLIRRRRQFSH